MKKSLDSVQSNLDTLRAGRASANLLDRVVVDYYGAETPLNQLAGIRYQRWYTPMRQHRGMHMRGAGAMRQPYAPMPT